MNEKNLNNRELAQIKRIAQNVDADYQKVCKLNEKIEALTKERDEIQTSINEMEAPVIRKTGGLRTTDIFMKTIVPQFNADGTPKTDKDGRQIKTTKYVLRYPEASTAEILAIQVDAVHPSESINTPSTEGMPGSDFDIDKSDLPFGV